MSRSRLAYLALPILALAVSAAGAAPPAGFSAGPHPYVGSPGAYNPSQYIYPAPGVYGATTFQPFALPTLSASVPAYNVPASPPEWPAVANAKITIRVPADAKLWVDGMATKQTGAVRTFSTPTVLRAGLTYKYSFRAEWMEGGRSVTRDRDVFVRATGASEVDFTKP